MRKVGSKVKKAIKVANRAAIDINRKSINSDICQELISHTYKFGKVNQDSFTNDFRFEKDFTIGGYSDNNEKYWGIYNQELRIFDINKNVTSVFVIKGDNFNYISGKSIKYPSVKFVLQSLGVTKKISDDVKTSKNELTSDEQTLFRIQNVILPPKDKINTEERNLYYKGTESINFNSINLIDGYNDFSTYLNMVSLKKWSNYTNANKFYLYLNVQGKFKLNIVYSSLVPKNGHIREVGLEEAFKEIEKSNVDGIFKRNAMNYQTTETDIKKNIFIYSIDVDEVTELAIPIELVGNENAMVGFQIDGAAQIYDAGWYVTVDKTNIRPINIAINTTTFKKEAYILKNLSHIQEQIINVNSEELGLNQLGDAHIFVNVVDNGQSLDSERIDSDFIKVHPNPNVGGAGGFTRGMIETLSLRDNQKFDATHILFMDDDIEVLPESFKRTYALLSILKDSYKDHFISGAMLDNLDGITQYEDTGFVSRNKDTAYMPTKDRYNLTNEKDILRNDLDYPIKDQYAAWWYCVAPMKFIDEKSMSLPIFYRGDDIEFSIRNKAKIMTLNGLAVWHLPFYTKKSKALENYLVSRNSFIDQSVNGFVQDVDYIEKYVELYKKELRMFNYGAADQVLDALDDYMKGPEYIATLNGIEVIKRESAKNEIFTDEIPDEIARNLHTVDEYWLLNPQDLRVFIDSDNGHGLPDFVLNKYDDLLENVPIVNQEMLENPGKQFMRKRIVVFDTYNKKMAIRERNQEKYEAIEARYHKLITKFEQEKEQIAQAYRNHADIFHSKEFWVEYLGLEV